MTCQRVRAPRLFTEKLPVSISEQSEVTYRVKKFFLLAKHVAYKSDHNTQLGAVIARKGTVISVGFNRNTKTHPISHSINRTLHAEMDAVVGIDRSLLVSADIYVYREDRNGSAKLAKPCPLCEEILRRVGIRKVFYSDETGRISSFKL